MSLEGFLDRLHVCLEWRTLAASGWWRRVSPERGAPHVLSVSHLSRMWMSRTSLCVTSFQTHQHRKQVSG